MLTQNINLVKSIPDKKIRDIILRVYYGILPCDGETRSVEDVLAGRLNIENEVPRTLRIDPSKR